MSDKPLVAHSLAEAYLYLMATPCGSCGRGPLQGSDARDTGGSDSVLVLSIDATCGACRQVTSYTFYLPHGTAAGEPAEGTVVNGTEQMYSGDALGHSQVQWTTVYTYH